MKAEILQNLNSHAQLERLYRADKSAFKRAFNALYPELQNISLADYWNERLNYTRDEISWGTRKDLLFVIIASLVAGLIAKLPAILSIDEAFFYTRNAGFILFPALSAYFAWKNKLPAGKIAFIVLGSLAGLLFINFLPNNQSDTLALSCMHLVLYLWCILGFAFVGSPKNDAERRSAYLSYNGDLIVITTLICIAGAILSGVTIGLFSLIGIKIEEFYFRNIVLFVLPAAPIMGTWLIQTNPQLVGKISPLIARIFSPIVLVMLTAYLIAIIYSGKNPYNDREFLLLFNGLLIGVMAIIFFSIAGTSSTKTRAEIWVLLLLSTLTIVVNGVALSAILFRISEWGISPNRAAILGSNVLILVNLLLVAARLVALLPNKTDTTGVKKVISWYLPVYFAWAAIVLFIFPYLFGFK
jgi:hypothetical protein